MMKRAQTLPVCSRFGKPHIFPDHIHDIKPAFNFFNVGIHPAVEIPMSFARSPIYVITQNSWKLYIDYTTSSQFKYFGIFTAGFIYLQTKEL